MAASSALARVLSFRRAQGPADAAEASALTPPGEGAPIDATPVGVEAAPPPADMPYPAAEEPAAASSGKPVLTIELPSFAQLTLASDAAPTDESRAVAPPDPVRDAVTVDAITAIEADIASLLSTMSEFSDARPATETPAATSEDDEAGEDATLALLSELDRLWQADPMIGAAHQS